LTKDELELLLRIATLAMQVNEWTGAACLLKEDENRIYELIDQLSEPFRRERRERRDKS
jgi:hypothetical protein